MHLLYEESNFPWLEFGFLMILWKKEPYLYAHERSKRQKAGKKGMPTVIMYLPPEYDNAFNLFIGNRIANKKIYGGMYLML